jgi:hypothetical protein
MHKWAKTLERWSWVESFSAWTVLVLAACMSQLFAAWSIGYHVLIVEQLETEKRKREECRWITDFDVQTAKRVARSLVRPLQCRACGFGPVEHYLCEDISDQACPMCFTRVRFVGDGYKAWDPTTDFSGILANAKRRRARALQLLASDRAHQQLLALAVAALLAGFVDLLSFPARAPMDLVLALLFGEVLPKRLGYFDDPPPTVDHLDCAARDCHARMSKRARRRSVKYQCGHRAHFRCRGRECSLCE